MEFGEARHCDADVLIVCSALEFAQNGQTVAEDTGVLILLVNHWRTTYSSERKAGSQDQEKVQHDRGYQLETTCYPVHSYMKCLGHNFYTTYSHGKMYLMEMLSLVSEVHNMPSIVSDRDASADEVGFAGLRLFCLIFLVDVEVKRIH